MRSSILPAATALVLAGIIAVGGLSAQENVRKRRASDRETVDRQHAADLARIEKIKRDLGAFKDEINRRLGTDNKIDDPVDPDAIDDIERLDHFHSHKKIPPP